MSGASGTSAAFAADVEAAPQFPGVSRSGRHENRSSAEEVPHGTFPTAPRRCASAPHFSPAEALDGASDVAASSCLRTQSPSAFGPLEEEEKQRPGLPRELSGHPEGCDTAAGQLICVLSNYNYVFFFASLILLAYKGYALTYPARRHGLETGNLLLIFVVQNLRLYAGHLGVETGDAACLGSFLAMSCLMLAELAYLWGYQAYIFPADAALCALSFAVLSAEGFAAIFHVLAVVKAGRTRPAACAGLLTVSTIFSVGVLICFVTAACPAGIREEDVSTA